MFEHHIEENKDRHPHRDHLARYGSRDHGADHACGHHPVAEHAAGEQRRHACRTVRCIAERPRLADIAECGADLVGILREAERRHERHHEGDRERAGEIAEEDETPVSQHPGKRDAWPLIDQRERRENEHPGQKVEAEQIQHGKADGKQQRSHDRLTGIDVDRDGKPGRERQNGAGHIGADHGVACRHEDLSLHRHPPSW